MEVEVRADPSGLQAGNNSGEITLIAPQAKNSPLKVPVVFEVAQPPPAFGLEPQSLTFTMTEGEALPDSQGLVVSNLGGGSLDWAATTAGEWFALSATSGTAPSTLTVEPTDADLPAGEYSGAIVFTAPGAQPATATLSLKVEARTDPDPEPRESEGCGCASRNPAGKPWLLLLASIGVAWLARRRS
jgi:MYXO-CTERM domain-containing protein